MTESTHKRSKIRKCPKEKRVKKAFKKDRLRGLEDKEFSREMECPSYESLRHEGVQKLTKFLVEFDIKPLYMVDRYVDFVTRDYFKPCETEEDIMKLILQTFPKFIASQGMEEILGFAIALHDFIKQKISPADFRRMMREIIPVPDSKILSYEWVYGNGNHRNLWHYYCVRATPELAVRDDYLTFLFFAGIYLVQQYSHPFPYPFLEDLSVYARLHPILHFLYDYAVIQPDESVYNDLITLAQSGYYEWMPLETIIYNTTQNIKNFFVQGKWRNYNIAEITELLKIYSIDHTKCKYSDFFKCKWGNHNTDYPNQDDEDFDNFVEHYIPALRELYEFGCLCLVLYKHKLFALMFDEMCEDMRYYFTG